MIKQILKKYWIMETWIIFLTSPSASILINTFWPVRFKQINNGKSFVKMAESKTALGRLWKPHYAACWTWAWFACRGVYFGQTEKAWVHNRGRGGRVKQGSSIISVWERTRQHDELKQAQTQEQE